MMNGATVRQVITVPGADDVIFRSKEFHSSQILLAGEQKMLPIPGFDMGNTPQAFSHLALISAAFNLDKTLSGRRK